MPKLPTYSDLERENGILNRRIAHLNRQLNVSIEGCPEGLCDACGSVLLDTEETVSSFYEDDYGRTCRAYADGQAHECQRWLDTREWREFTRGKRDKGSAP